MILAKSVSASETSSRSRVERQTKPVAAPARVIRELRLHAITRGIAEIHWHIYINSKWNLIAALFPRYLGVHEGSPWSLSL